MTSKFTQARKPRGKQSGNDWVPEPYQKQGVKLLVSQGAAGLFLDPGMGKTSITLAAIKILLKKQLVRKVLIVAPLRPCYLTWPAEIKKWNDFKHLRYVILHGAKKEEALKVDADIYLTNPEGLAWLFNGGKPNTDHKRLAELGFDMLVLDESTKFKNTNTERFSILRPVLPKFKRRYILTGSPMPRSYMDLFGQIYTLDLGNALGSYITHYRHKYFDPTGYGGYDWTLRAGADKEIQAQLEHLVMHFSAEEHLKMPKLRINPIYIELPPAAQDLYDELEEHFITEVGDKVITAVNAGAATGKLSQIANGGLYYESEINRKTIEVHHAKTTAVVDLIEELSGQPALLNYEFTHDLERLTKALGAKTPNMSSGGMKELRLLQDKWNAGEIPVMLGQPASMGHGLNLQQGGHHLIMHSLMWDWEVVDQWMRRLYRAGNKSPYVCLHLIIARGTIDEVKYALMLQKDKNQKAFLETLKCYIQSKKS